jgi:hypothetical protein
MSMPSAEFELAILAIKRLQTYALESKATGLGLSFSFIHNIYFYATFSPKIYF